jgi:hypothetical protein
VLLHAAILLGLACATRLSTLGPGWLDVAAWLVVVSSALIAAKDTVNWLTGIKDEFSEKPKTAAPLWGFGAWRHPRRSPTRGRARTPDGSSSASAWSSAVRGSAR